MYENFLRILHTETIVCNCADKSETIVENVENVNNCLKCENYDKLT